MKKSPSVSIKNDAKTREIIAKIGAAQKLADSAKKDAQEAKAVFKRVRKAYKLAKKAAKAARGQVKELQNSLEAAKATKIRAKPVARKRKLKPVRKGIPVAIEPVVTPPVLPVAAE